MPEPSVDKELLVGRDAADMVQDHHARLILYLDQAMVHHVRNTGVPIFTLKLFRLLGYVYRYGVACTNLDLHFLVCGERRRARADVYIIGGSQIRLVVREDKCVGNRDPADAQAQLVAATVAAFRENNKNRVAAGRDPLSEKVSRVIFCC